MSEDKRIHIDKTKMNSFLNKVFEGISGTYQLNMLYWRQARPFQKA